MSIRAGAYRGIEARNFDFGHSHPVGICVGYKKPLFLGGSDTTDNLELAKLEVYWEISAQLLNKTRDLPIGTHVNNIGMS